MSSTLDTDRTKKNSLLCCFYCCLALSWLPRCFSRRRRRRQQQRFHRSYNHRNLLLLQNRKSTPASKISSDASRDRQKKIPFRENSNRFSPPNLPPHLKLRKKLQKRKPLATIAKPPSATGLSNRSSAATLPVTSASTPSSRKAARKPRKRQTTIKTTQ